MRCASIPPGKTSQGLCPLLSPQIPWLVASLSWRALLAETVTRFNNWYEIHILGRITV